MKGNNPYLRYRRLDELLRTRKSTLQELAEACQQVCDTRIPPSERTIWADLKFLREHENAPIPKRAKYFYYTDKSFSIFKNPLNTQDLTTLQRVVEMLKALGNLPQLQDLDDIIFRIEFQQSIEREADKPIIAFERLDSVKGFEHVRALHGAIVRHQVLKLAYKTYHAEEEYEFIFHPHFLKEYNHRWFVLGLDANSNKVRTCSLDRIVRFGEIPSAKYKPAEMDFEALFKQRIGVSWLPNEKVETVRLQLNRERAPYLQTKPLHPSQKIVDMDEQGRKIFELNLVVNFELVAKILEFGCDAEVIEPATLRLLVKDVFTKGYNNYQEKKN